MAELKKKIGRNRGATKSKKRLSGLETAAEPTLDGHFVCSFLLLFFLSFFSTQADDKNIRYIVTEEE